MPPSHRISMLRQLRRSIAPPTNAAAVRNATNLGLRRFSAQPGAETQPPRSWVPTPYVTETIVGVSQVLTYHGMR